MDIDELRRAFTLSATIYEQIRHFRSERVAQVLKAETPIPLMLSSMLILHLIPVASFRSRQVFDVATMPDLATRFPPIGASGWDHRLNLDGHVSYSSVRNDRTCRSYTQFFRNGIVEAVLSDVVTDSKEEGKLLLASYYERRLTQESRPVAHLLSGLRQVGVQPPIWGFVTLTGVRGAKIPTDHDFGDENRAIDRDVLLLPEFIIDDLGTDPITILRPVFDLIWNASGFAHSFNFDKNGNWVGR